VIKRVSFQVLTITRFSRQFFVKLAPLWELYGARCIGQRFRLPGKNFTRCDKDGESTFVHEVVHPIRFAKCRYSGNPLDLLAKCQQRVLC
jgi:hypothetical protein